MKNNNLEKPTECISNSMLPTLFSIYGEKYI